LSFFSFSRACIRTLEFIFPFDSMPPPLVRRRALSAAAAAALLLLLLLSPLLASATGSPPPSLLSVPLAKRRLDARSLARQAEALRARHGAASSALSSSSSGLGSVLKGEADVELVDFLDAQVRKERREREKERREKRANEKERDRST
jgi:hypothetical protein